MNRPADEYTRARKVSGWDPSWKSTRVVLENGHGDRWEFGPGAGFVVPAGFEGTWEVIEECTKFYAIFETRT